MFGPVSVYFISDSPSNFFVRCIKIPCIFIIFQKVEATNKVWNSILLLEECS